MQNVIFNLIFATAVIATSSAGLAMPGPKHNAGTSAILEVAVEKGGAKGVDPAKAKAVHDWMDNPSKRLGSNHNRIRHNPVKAARVFSGTGKIDPATLNVARMHKIQDIAQNSKPVDGWKITQKMRRQARQILKHVEKHGGLPKKLPVWVDESGSLLGDAARSISTGARVRSNVDDAARGVKFLSKNGKLAGPAGVAIEVGCRATVAFSTEKAYRTGKISKKERTKKHAKNGGAAAGGMAGAMGGAKAGAVAGGAIGACFAGVGAPVGAAIGGIGGAIGGGLFGDWLGGKLGERGATKMTEEK